VIKQAPSIGRILVMVGFALSVFAMLLFLWVSFGGGLPLRPKGYQVHVAFPEATQLAEEAEVRISGVRVGRVKSKEPDPRTGLTDTTLEIEPRFAPIPRDARAILRQKTLLGETYVELTPGHRSAGFVPDGGRLPRGNVGQTVELDEILRTLDPETRRAFQTWLDQQGRAVENRGPDINAALASLAPFADKTDEVLAILRREEAATRQLVRDTGEVFDALSERSGQLRGLIANSNKVFETTARRDRQLEEAIRAFPTFLDESRVTVERLSRFARDTDPLVNQLRPAARAMSPTFEQLAALSPDLKRLLVSLDPLIRASRSGLPAVQRVLDNTRPLLAGIDPFMRSFIPIIDYLALYRREIAAFFANDVAATQAKELSQILGRPAHYLRVTNPLNPENLGAFPFRLPTNRSNPYPLPGSLLELANGSFTVFGSYLCRPSNPMPTLSPAVPQPLLDRLREIAYAGQADPGDTVPAPPCREQTPLGQLVGQSGRYPRLERLP